MRLPGVAPQAPAEEDGGEYEDRKGAEHDRGQLEGGDCDQGRATHEEHALPAKLREGVDHRPLDLRDVGGDPAGEFPHPPLAKKCHGQRDQPLVAMAPQVREGALPHPVEGKGAVEGPEGLQGNRADQDQGDLIKAQEAYDGHHRPVGFQGRVNERSGKQREREAAQCPKKKRGEAEEEPPAVRTQVTGKRQRLPQAFPGDRRLWEAVELGFLR